MKRRQLVWGAGAAAALMAAAAGVWWRSRHETAASPVLPLAGGGPAGLWQMRFDAPDGSEVRMASFKGQPLLLNFWGSWCPPCVAEMPDLDRFAKTFGPAGWRVVGLAVDNPKAVREFLARKPVSYTIAVAGFEGAGLSRELGNEQAAMPFSVVFRPDGSIALTKTGAAHWAELQTWVERAATPK